MKTETRYSDGLEADGGKLTGVVMRYGSHGDKNERFAPGVFGASIGDVMLNVQHDRSKPLARTGGSGLELKDSPAALTMTATLPKTREARDTVALVKSGVLRGLSVEFRALKERRVGGVRVIERAELLAVGVVDKPSYEASTVAARSADARVDDTTWWTL